MATLALDHDEVIVELNSAEKAGAMHGSVRVPLSAVRRVRYVDRARTEIRGIKFPGTSVPRVVALGSWRTLTRHAFVATHRSDPGYVIDLDGQVFDYLIVSSPRVASLDALVE